MKELRRLKSVYGHKFNRRHKLPGHVFQGRYEAILVEKESHPLEFCRYVVRKPVKAGMAKTAEDRKWSSHRATAGFVAAPIWLETGWVLGRFGRDRSVAEKACRNFVTATPRQESPWKSLKGEIFLGSEEFLPEMGGLVRKEDRRGIAKARITPDRPDPETVLGSVASECGIPVSRVLCKRNRVAYMTGIYLLRRVCNLSPREAAEMAGVSAPRVS